MKSWKAWYWLGDGRTGLQRFNQRWNLGLLIEPRDLWIGWYWTLTKHNDGERILHVYRSIVPCVILHFWIVARQPAT